MDETLKPEDLFDEPKPQRQKGRLPKLLEELAPPPRSVSTGVRSVLLLTRNTGCLGWALFLFGTVITVLCLTKAFDPADLIPPCVVPWETLSEPGRVIACENAKLKVNGASTYRLTFEYTVQGERRTRTYFTLQSRKEGETFPVQHRWNSYRPEKSVKIQEYLVLTVLLFPIIGACFLFFQFLEAYKTIHLMRYGESAAGVPEKMEETGVRFNNQPQFRVTYTFRNSLGEFCSVSTKTYDVSRIRKNRVGTLLYDPQHPDWAAVLEDFQNDFYVTPSGGVRMKWRCLIPLLFWLILLLGTCVAITYIV